MPGTQPWPLIFEGQTTPQNSPPKFQSKQGAPSKGSRCKKSPGSKLKGGIAGPFQGNFWAIIPCRCVPSLSMSISSKHERFKLLGFTLRFSMTQSWKKSHDLVGAKLIHQVFVHGSHLGFCYHVPKVSAAILLEEDGLIPGLVHIRGG